MVRGSSRLYTATWICLICAITAAALPVQCASRNDMESVNEAIHAWAEAWDKGDVPKYLAHYATDFVPTGSLTRAQWEQKRRARLTMSKLRHVLLRDVQVNIEADTAKATFTQHYVDMYVISTARKRMSLIKQAGAWKIREELVESENIVKRDSPVAR